MPSPDTHAAQEGKMGEWISVKERVPNDGEMVLVYGNGMYNVERYPYQIARLMNDSPEEQFDCPCEYWMPLPSPPTQEVAKK